MRPTAEWSCLPNGTRTIVGSLNKLSERNYVTIRTKVLAAIDSHDATVNDVCDALLVKSYQETGYLTLYVRMIADVRSVDADAASSVATDFVDGVVRMTRNLEDELHVDDCEGGYDAFCSVTKKKRHAVGKLRTALALLKDGIVGAPSSEEFLECMLEQLSVARSDDHVELLLEFISDFARTFPATFERKSASVRRVCDYRIDSTCCSARNRFKIMDVCELCPVV